MKHIENTCSFAMALLINILKDLDFEVEKLSVRDIAKTLDNFEHSYQTVEIKINDNFRFKSDTPLVKLLATLLRMGVNEDKLIPFFFIGISNMEQLMSILGCFAVNNKILSLGTNVSFGGKLYHFSFGYRDGFKVFENVIESKAFDSTGYKILEINLNSIIVEALKYEN